MEGSENVFTKVVRLIVFESDLGAADKQTVKQTSANLDPKYGQ